MKISYDIDSTIELLALHKKSKKSQKIANNSHNIALFTTNSTNPYSNTDCFHWKDDLEQIMSEVKQIKEMVIATLKKIKPIF